VPLTFHPRSLSLPKLGLRLDPHRACPFAFVSHGHADHFARHEKIITSVANAHLLRKRYSLAKDRLLILDWEDQITIDGHLIQLFPAGHITGSAMIRLEHEGESLLYTGDFKTRDSFTAESPVFPKADILAMETTFGLPHFVFPPTEQIHTDILTFAKEGLKLGETPIFYAYSLGKAQEVYAILTRAQLPVVLNKSVYDMTQAVRETGIDLAKPTLLGESIPPDTILIAPPNFAKSPLVKNLKTKRTAMLSGWALTPGAQYRYRVDTLFPLSDHADFPGLLEAVEKVSPKLIYTLHGSTREFATELRARGHDAWSIYGNDQLELFGKEELPHPGKDR
jgi:DNA ligase-1